MSIPLEKGLCNCEPRISLCGALFVLCAVLGPREEAALTTGLRIPVDWEELCMQRVLDIPLPVHDTAAQRSRIKVPDWCGSVAACKYWQSTHVTQLSNSA